MAESTDMADAPAGNKFYQEVFLIQTEGPGKGRRFPLRDGRNILGRNGDIVLENDQISRQHACVTVEETIAVEDMGSSYGTVLNGKMLVGGSYLFDKDELHLGPFGFRLGARKREDRKGLLWAAGVLFAGILLLGISFYVYQLGTLDAERTERRIRSEYVTVTTDSAYADVYAEWKDWETATLPSREELLEENIQIDGKTAEREFTIGMRLYQDRLVEPGNAYRALVHFKRCLSLLSLLPYNNRPSLARRSLDMVSELHDAIRSNCENRVFSYIRSFQMQYWAGCFQSLQQICDYSPRPESPYNAWAKERIDELNKRLN